MDIYICIGSSCHLKGSRSVIEKMEERIRREHLEDRVNIRGSFCMETAPMASVSGSGKRRSPA